MLERPITPGCFILLATKGSGLLQGTVVLHAGPPRDEEELPLAISLLNPLT
jgi:hypothetical protein